jgi:hypothetical protein
MMMSSALIISERRATRNEKMRAVQAPRGT